MTTSNNNETTSDIEDVTENTTLSTLLLYSPVDGESLDNNDSLEAEQTGHWLGEGYW